MRREDNPLAEFRRSKSWTQRQLARSTGISEQTIYLLENGKFNNPFPEACVKLSEHFPLTSDAWEYDFFNWRRQCLLNLGSHIRPHTKEMINFFFLNGAVGFKNFREELVIQLLGLDREEADLVFLDDSRVDPWSPNCFSTLMMVHRTSVERSDHFDEASSIVVNNLRLLV